MSLLIRSGATSDELTIDPTSKAARATLYDSAGNLMALSSGAQPSVVGGIPAFGLNDRSVLPIRTDRMGNLASALHTPLFMESFEGTTINLIRWLISSTTMAATQSTIGGLLFNSGSITTITTGYMAQSQRRFLKTQRAPLQRKCRARIAHVNNSVMEIGFGDAATFNSANTAGAYWQVTSTGVVQPVLTFNSVDITGTDIRSSLTLTNYYTWDVIVDDDEAIFLCQDSSTGLIISRQSIPLPLTAQRLWSSIGVPTISRLYNTGVAPASASQMMLTDDYVAILDVDLNAPLAETMAMLDRNSIALPSTAAQLAQWANSAEPASATLSNTTAGYATLGGKFQFAAVAGAVTDYCLFAYQVPPPFNLMVTGVDVETWNVGAAVATTPTLLTWFISHGGLVSLASTSVRKGLGAQSLPVAAAIGAKTERVTAKPLLYVPSSRYVHIALRMPVGTATASQIIAGMVNVEGYFF